MEEGGTYSVNADAVDRLFVRSGGEGLLEAQMRAVEEERAKQRQGAPEYEPEGPYEWPDDWGWLRTDDPLREAIIRSRPIVDHSLDL